MHLDNANTADTFLNWNKGRTSILNDDPWLSEETLVLRTCKCPFQSGFISAEAKREGELTMN